MVSAIINLADQLGHSVWPRGRDGCPAGIPAGAPCSRIQGYLVGKPVPLHTFVAQLDRWRKIAVALANPII
ncbi:hypothetical protein [Skermanella pratensis]|uniref:hypothetical protein n=1 Tax=Skermanella pratensis TaxID=2233999 RepID=UPI001FE93BEF|nr:hypothetical protein [Skermanella pratensis]